MSQVGQYFLLLEPFRTIIIYFVFGEIGFGQISIRRIGIRRIGIRRKGIRRNGIRRIGTEPKIFVINYR